jgi:predicted MFS family arabinose efflux permease
VTLFPLLVAGTLEHYGWRGSFLWIAGIVLLVGVPAQYLFLVEPRRPARDVVDPAAHVPPAGMTLAEALRSGRFWLLLSAMPLCGGALMAAVHMAVPLLQSRGFPVMIGAQAMACVGLAAMVGEPVIGFFLDRSNHPRRLSGVYLLGIAGLFILLYGHDANAFRFAGVLLGIAIGGEFTALSYLLSRYFGLRALGAVSGIAFGAVLAINALFTVILNAVFDATGSYATAILALMPVLLWNAVVPWLLGTYVFASSHGAAEAH